MQKLQFVLLDLGEGREETDCLIVAVFECGGRQYIALAPEDTDDELCFFEYVPDGEPDGDTEGFDLLDIEDDETFEKVIAAFESLPVTEGTEEEDNEG